MEYANPESPEQVWLETGRLAELGLLSATLVHELRQPLFAIKAMLQLAIASCPAGPHHDQVRITLEQAVHMERILAAYGGLVQRPGGVDEPFAPNAPVAAAAETLAHRARQLHATLSLDLGEALPILRGNQVALQQVVVNLVQNALDASSSNTAPAVHVRTSRSGDRVAIEVRDNGTGIPPEVLPHVFDPFFTTKPPGRGTGLGLTIARELVRRAGGTVDFATGSGGTSFTVLLPTQEP